MCFLRSMAECPDQSLNNDLQAKCHERRQRHTSRRMRTSADASSVVRAADPFPIEKGLKLLNGKMQQPVGRRFDPCRRRHFIYLRILLSANQKHQ